MNKTKLHEQAAAEAARLTQALGARVAEVQLLETQRDLEVQRRAEQTRSAATSTGRLQEQASALSSDLESLKLDLEHATKTHHEAQLRVTVPSYANTHTHTHTRTRTHTHTHISSLSQVLFYIQRT